jgi:membrane fusion protein, multidrug efflux system
MQKILKPALWLLAGIGAVALIAFKINSNQQKSAQAVRQELQPIPFAVDATTVSEKIFSNELALLGSVEPSNTSIIYSETDGRIAFSSIEKGRTVSKGEVLATLDPALRKAAHQINKVNFEKAKIDFARIEQLFAESNASKIDVENARNQLLLLEQQTFISEKQLNQTIIRASVSGIISDKKVTVGEYVQAGTPLGSLVDLTTVLVKVFIPESRIASIEAGQLVNVTTDVFPSLVFKGTLKNIVPVANEAKAFPVEIAISNSKKEKLLAGMTMHALFGSTNSTRSLVIPRTALLGNATGYFVFAISSKTKPVKTTVLLGQDFGEFIEVKSGLTAGDTIITSGQANIEQGKVLAGLRLK